MKNYRFIIYGCFLLYLFFELCCWGTIQLLSDKKSINYFPLNNKSFTQQEAAGIDKIIKGKNQYHKLDPLYGWSIKPNGIMHEGKISANAEGFRANRSYSNKKPVNTLRILSFGDSFTHSDGVSNGLTWQDYLEENKNVEALNFGVSGWGLDQAYLRFINEGLKYEADVVLIGFLSENIYRNKLVYWPFYINYLKRTPLSLILPKPRFKIEHDQLVLIEQPLKNLEDLKKFRAKPEEYLPLLGKNDYFYQNRYKAGRLDFIPSIRLAKIFIYDILKWGDDVIRKGRYNTKSESYLLTIKLLDAFIQKAEEKDLLPIVLLFPDANDIANKRKGEVERYRPLTDHLKKKNYHSIDVMTVINTEMADMSIDQIIQGHYTPITNEIIANSILKYIMKLISP